MAAMHPAVVWLIVAAVVGVTLLIATFFANRNRNKKKKGAEGDDGFSMGFDNQSFVGKIGTKKRQKLEMKAEKRAYRESESLLEEFISYIKEKKVVLLEDLAFQFGLRTQDAINRLQTLQEMERVTGVTDDRGKFIYISPEELEAVAKFIKQRGRVTISELAESSNTLVNLQADHTHTHTPSTAQVSA
ncbi:PREDICTED: DDRGK domain-containing protein 1-like [Acropora digitifera]|uniref:DDRGK domain-containing protein 1-like n=1 Tax=Acropora digitifera TaxID=70779 RepID=UPI00077B2125|nr:PREDICTED: DDRGK domain-containing protein 1-like [Acropora digitifera]